MLDFDEEQPSFDQDTDHRDPRRGQPTERHDVARHGSGGERQRQRQDQAKAQRDDAELLRVLARRHYSDRCRIVGSALAAEKQLCVGMAYGVVRSRIARKPRPTAPVRPPRMMPIGMTVKNTKVPE